MREPESLHLTANDGFRLAATHFFAQGEAKARIVVAGATAVPQGFYRRFAEYASTHGYDVITVDYRGIARSRPAQLKGFRMNLLDWAKRDLAAAIDYLDDGQLPLYYIGHSYGGHALGLLPRPNDISAAYLFGTGAGWHGWMPAPERYKILFAWKILLPLLTWWKGYTPWKLLGIGEDLPRDVYRQWRAWCQYPHYFFDDPEMAHLHDEFARVTLPITVANAKDDLWSPASSRDAFMKGYRNALITRLDLDPQTFRSPIGHMGYFRANAHPLWDDALTWFETHPKR